MSHAMRNSFGEHALLRQWNDFIKNIARRIAGVRNEIKDCLRLPRRRQVLNLLAGVLAALSLSACASSEYMGISLKPGAAESELQELAQRARTGDKQAQLELGIRFEEGRGVPWSGRVAERLYDLAARDIGGRQVMYIPGANGAVSPSPIYAGRKVPGLEEAARRLRSIRQHPYADPEGRALSLDELVRIDRAFSRCVSMGVPVIVNVPYRADAPNWDASDRIMPMRTCVGRLVRSSERDQSIEHIARCNFAVISSKNGQSGSRERTKSLWEWSKNAHPSEVCRSSVRDLFVGPIYSGRSDHQQISSEFLVSDIIKFLSLGVIVENQMAYSFTVGLCKYYMLTFSPAGRKMDALEERLCRAWSSAQIFKRGRRF